MSRNSSGTYSLPAGNPVISGTSISSTWANTTLSDIGSELTNSLDRGGRGAMTAPLPLANGTVAAPALTFGSDTDTGLYRVNANDMAAACGGTKVAEWTSTGVALPLGLVVTQSQSNTAGVTATGNGTASGLNGYGGATGIGVYGEGGGNGTGTSGVGVQGQGKGSSAGVVGFGGASAGPGVSGVAGTGGLAATFSGGAVDVGSQKITSLATPTANTDACTKAYADGLSRASILQFSIDAGEMVADGAEHQMFAFGGARTAGGVVEVYILAPCAGTVTALYANNGSGALPNGLLFKTYISGVAQTVTATVSGGTGVASDTSHSFTVAAGDLINVRYKQTGGGALPVYGAIVSLKFQGS